MNFSVQVNKLLKNNFFKKRITTHNIAFIP